LVLANFSTQNDVISKIHTVTFRAHDRIVTCHQNHDARLEENDNAIGRRPLFDIFIHLPAVWVKGTVDLTVSAQVCIGIAAGA
jgi:hypothetical protein